MIEGRENEFAREKILNFINVLYYTATHFVVFLTMCILKVCDRK